MLSTPLHQPFFIAQTIETQNHFAALHFYLPCPVSGMDSVPGYSISRKVPSYHLYLERSALGFPHIPWFLQHHCQSIVTHRHLARASLSINPWAFQLKLQSRFFKNSHPNYLVVHLSIICPNDTCLNSYSASSDPLESKPGPPLHYISDDPSD